MRIRVPEDVKAWIEAEADKNLRTQNAEIVMAIRKQMEKKTPATAGK
jgi:hypothetical protein